MTRIEKNATMTQSLKEMKGDVDEVKRRTRRSRPWLTCSLALLALLVAVGLWVGWIVASTGLVRVPLFTSLAYEIPTPTRPVTPGVPAEVILQETFTNTLTRALYEGGGTLTNRSITIELEETSMTASLRSLLEESDLTWLDSSQTQVVVEPEVGVEVFIPIENSPQSTAITLVFNLGAQEGNLVVAPTDIFVGNARVPDIITTVFLQPFLETELAKLNAAMVGYASIHRIELLPRAISINGELSVSVESSL